MTPNKPIQREVVEKVKYAAEREQRRIRVKEIMANSDLLFMRVFDSTHIYIKTEVENKWLVIKMDKPEEHMTMSSSHIYFLLMDETGVLVGINTKAVLDGQFPPIS